MLFVAAHGSCCSVICASPAAKIFSVTIRLASASARAPPGGEAQHAQGDDALRLEPDLPNFQLGFKNP